MTQTAETVTSIDVAEYFELFVFETVCFYHLSPFKETCFDELDHCFSKNGKFIVDQCPYFNAVLLENFRFRPVTDSLPHLCIQDTNVDGTLIKKGSIVMASLVAVMHNPKDFPQPEEFKPERFFVDGQFQEHLSKFLLE